MRASRTGAPARPMGPSPAGPSFCVLLFGWSHLPSQPKDTRWPPHPGNPRPRPGAPPDTAVGIREGGAEAGEMRASEDSSNRRVGEARQPRPAAKGRGPRPLLVRVSIGLGERPGVPGAAFSLVPAAVPAWPARPRSDFLPAVGVGERARPQENCGGNSLFRLRGPSDSAPQFPHLSRGPKPESERGAESAA